MMRLVKLKSPHISDVHALTGKVPINTVNMYQSLEALETVIDDFNLYATATKACIKLQILKPIVKGLMDEAIKLADTEAKAELAKKHVAEVKHYVESIVNQ
jgi:hypothetical protein